MSNQDDFKKTKLGRENYQRSSESFFELNTKVRSNIEEINDGSEFFNQGIKSFQNQWNLRYYPAATEATLGVYFNGAYQKAQVAYLNGSRRWHTYYRIGFAEIDVRLNGRGVHTLVKANDNFYFEFLASGNPIVSGSVTVGGNTLTAYKPVTVGVNVKVGDGQVATTAEIRNGTRAFFGENSIVGRPNQAQLINEPVSYPRGARQLNRLRFPIALYESYSPMSAHTGVHTRNCSWGYDQDRTGAFFGGGWMEFWLTEMDRTRRRGGFTPHILRDLGYDIPFVEGNNFQPVQKAVLTGAADWPRAVGLQTVTDPTYGTRDFAVYVDAFNQFFVFPTAQIEAWNDFAQNVDAMYVQQATYTMPAWAFVPATPLKTYFATGNVNDALVDFPELDWKSNHLGTKFVAIAYERSAFTYDATYFGASVGSVPFTVTQFNELRDQLGVGGRNNLPSWNAAHAPTHYFVAPGAVEIAVEITLTGHNPEDFSVTATPREVRRPTTSDRCALAVGYVWHDVFAPHVAGVPPVKLALQGDLVALDVEQWAKRGEAVLPVSAVAIVNMDTSADLFCSLVPSEIVAVDLTTLSFVAKVDNYEFTTKTFTAPTTVVADVEIQHFAMWVVTGLRSRELLFPTTLTDANKAYFTELVAAQGTTGRAVLAADTWYYVPLNEPRDWSDTDFGNARDFLAGPTQAQNKFTGPSSSPAISDTLIMWYWEFDTLNPVSYLIYCTAPKFGWHLYADLLCRYMNLGTQTTFFTHPNGTWAYWDNSRIYNPQGACYTADLYYIDAYAQWDAALLEHCTFDRVHLEARRTSVAIGSRNTSFLELYNRGVEATTLRGAMVDTVATLAPADFKATFVKQSESFGLDTRGYLKVQASWNGGTYYLYDTAVQGGATGTTFVVGGLLTSIEMQFTSVWSDGSSNLKTPASDPSHFHVRFANPLVIDAVKEN